MTFLIILFVWAVPLWFLLRYHFFSSYSYGQDVFYGVLMVMLLSWVGLLVFCLVVGSDGARQAFFIPNLNDEVRSMRSKMFWYKVRTFGLRLLLIKETS